MNDAQTLAYVQAAAVAVNLPLNDEQAARVAVHLQRTAGIAAVLDAFPLAPHDEPAELFHPAPFDRPR
ncbi:DUF4089 domain-containing protein [Hydrogenophaga sp.]|uniref:DUF4089 domain-containing protein n=1 Tax=Hydrogenophaga sp. TaxID=1904254 RepID=UPI002721BC8F|nr:DUF4089 domain-containing protein [Hydrogenophaga sp.]MDO8903842.1 DUF4089 domain-containing protein [Hydrogenophaga sp.]